MRREKLSKDLKELFSIIEDAHCAYEIWWILISREGRKEYSKVMVHYRDFFEPLARSTLISMIISLYKLFESNDRLLSLEKVLKEARIGKVIDSNYNKKLNRKLIESRVLWKKVCILRSNLLAHRSYNLTMREVYGLAKINPNQIKRLINLSLKIFNSLWVKLGNEPKKIEEFTAMYTRRVLEDLRNASSLG